MTISKLIMIKTMLLVQNSYSSESRPPLPVLCIDTSVGKLNDHFEPSKSPHELCLSSTSSVTVNAYTPASPTRSALILSPGFQDTPTAPPSISIDTTALKTAVITCESAQFKPKTTNFSATTIPKSDCTYLETGEAIYQPKCTCYPPKKPSPDLQLKAASLISRIKALQSITTLYSSDLAITDGKAVLVDDLPVIDTSRTTYKSMGPRRVEAPRSSPKTLQSYRDEYQAIMQEYDSMSVTELHSINPYQK